MADLQQLRAEAEAAIRAAADPAELDELRVRYLGRKAELTRVLRSIGELEPERRGPVGKEANSVRQALEALLEQRCHVEGQQTTHPGRQELQRQGGQAEQRPGNACHAETLAPRRRALPVVAHYERPERSSG